MAEATGEVALDKVPFPFRPMGGFVATGETFAKNWAAARNPSGLYVEAYEAAGLLPGGFVDRALEDAAAGDATDKINAEVGIYSVPMVSGDEFDETDGPAPIYYVNNREFGKSPRGTTAPRSVAGLFLCLDPDKPSTRALAWIGPEGYAIARAMLGLDAAQPEARAVITSLAACTSSGGVLTANANGAIGAQDTSVALAVGNVVIIPEGTTNLPDPSDAGPYEVLAVGAGGAKFRLARPSWWADGAAIPGFAIRVREGTFWIGTEWKSFAAQGTIVGTDAPALYPAYVTQSVSLGGGSPVGHATITNVPIRSATQTNYEIRRKTAATPSLTLEYVPLSITPGVLGTASVDITAAVAAGTINAADGSTLLVSIVNW